MANRKLILAERVKTFDVQSFADRAADAKQFKDAGGVILARNLEHVSAEIFTQDYPGLMFLNRGITVNNEGGYADAIKKLKLQVSGAFKDSGTNTNGTGKITLSGQDDVITTFTKEANSDWSEIELKKAEMQGINLPSRFLEAHFEVYNRELDGLGYLGRSNSAGTLVTPGLLNYTGFDSVNAGGFASTLTGVELYDALAGLITRQWNNVFSSESYKADTVDMPIGVYNQASTQITNSAGSEMSVLKALQANFPTVTFGATFQAGTAGTAGSVTVAYTTNRRALQFRVPVPLQLSSVHQRGHKYYMESYASLAGLDIIEDGAAAYLKGL